MIVTGGQAVENGPGEPQPLKRPHDVQTGRLEAAMAFGSDGHLQDSIHVIEIDAEQVALDDLDDPPYQPARRSDRELLERAGFEEDRVDSGYQITFGQAADLGF